MLIPVGMPNAGMYIWNSYSWEQNMDGKRFRIDRYLSDCTGDRLVTNPSIAVDGGKMDKTEQVFGVDLDYYQKDGKLKLVQQFSAKSWVYEKSRFFVSWYVYKEIDQPDWAI